MFLLWPLRFFLITHLIFFLYGCGGGGGTSGTSYAGLNLFPKTGTSFSGSTTAMPSNYEPNDVVTVTVNSEWIKDANGVPMEADYSFTYTVAP
tara:strand:+ start:94868 stop:95146 length:279 start_codon:yes stop_codon:yes gene_type:complete